MDKLRANFEVFKGELLKEVNSITFDELLWRCYYQGHIDTTNITQELSQEDVQKMVEDDCFMSFVQDCLENPDNIKDNTEEQNDYVRVTYPCPGRKDCLAWPDRCEDAGGNGEVCSRVINLSKLCGVPSADKVAKIKHRQDLLTDEEIVMLSNAVMKLSGN